MLLHHGWGQHCPDAQPAGSHRRADHKEAEILLTAVRAPARNRDQCYLYIQNQPQAVAGQQPCPGTHSAQFRCPRLPCCSGCKCLHCVTPNHSARTTVPLPWAAASSALGNPVHASCDPPGAALLSAAQNGLNNKAAPGPPVIMWDPLRVVHVGFIRHLLPAGSRAPWRQVLMRASHLVCRGSPHTTI